MPIRIRLQRGQDILHTQRRPFPGSPGDGRRPLLRQRNELRGRVGADERVEDPLGNFSGARVGVPVAQAEEEEVEVFVGERLQNGVDGGVARESWSLVGGGFGGFGG